MHILSRQIHETKSIWVQFYYKSFYLGKSSKLTLSTGKKNHLLKHYHGSCSRSSGSTILWKFYSLDTVEVRAVVGCVNEHISTFLLCFHQLFPPPLFGCLLREVEVHFIIDHLPLWIKAFQDLCEHVDCLLTAQTCSLGLELLQQVFSGHRFTDQIATDSFLRQLHITVGRVFSFCKP